MTGAANISLVLIAGPDGNLSEDGYMKMGGTGEITGLDNISPNQVSNVVTVDSFEAGVGASGSFSAEWADEGMFYGNITGTFDFDCE